MTSAGATVSHHQWSTAPQHLLPPGPPDLRSSHCPLATRPYCLPIPGTPRVPSIPHWVYWVPSASTVAIPTGETLRLKILNPSLKKLALRQPIGYGRWLPSCRKMQNVLLLAPGKAVCPAGVFVCVRFVKLELGLRTWGTPFCTACAHRVQRVPRSYAVFPGSLGGFRISGG